MGAGIGHVLSATSLNLQDNPSIADIGTKKEKKRAYTRALLFFLYVKKPIVNLSAAYPFVP